MLKYQTVAETAKKWGVSTRHVQNLCNQGRIPGAIKPGRDWLIPQNASNPSGSVGRPKS